MRKIELLREDILIELEQMQKTAQELELFYQQREAIPDTTLQPMEKAGVALSIANIYNGMENIFKRIVKFYGLPLPVGSSAHADLFALFSFGGTQPILPILIAEAFRSQSIALRKMRHYVVHGYAFKLDEERLIKALRETPSLFAAFKQEVERFLAALETTGGDD